MVLAVGIVLESLGGLMAQAVTLNYAVECFTDMAAQTTIIITFFRLAWGVALPFFINEWAKRVGIGWFFGTSAFISIALTAIPALLIWKGDSFRRVSILSSISSSEVGKIIK